MSLIVLLPKVKLEREGEVRKKVAIGATIGLTVGAVAGVLLAPKAGQETREDLMKTIHELPDKAKALLDKAHKVVGETTEKITEETNKVMCGEKETLPGLGNHERFDMKEDTLKGHLSHELKDGIKAWGKLTDDDFTMVKGQSEKFMGILHTAETLSDYEMRGMDGKIGTIKEFYFEAHHWTIRYIVANTGNWVTRGHVLISPYSLGAVNNEEKFIAVNLTKKQMEDSPTFETGQTLSRQFLDEYDSYYGLPKPNIARVTNMLRKSAPSEQSRDQQLHNTSDVTGYDIEASDGEIGDVKDFVIDDKTWAIRYLIVDTGGWLPGKKVLIAPQWIIRVDWEDSKVYVNLSREAIKKSPQFTEELTRDYEARLYKHYNRDGYWIE